MELAELLALIQRAGPGAVMTAVGVVIGGTMLGLWLVYTVVWRAVRRGVREANASMLAALPAPSSELAPPIYLPAWTPTIISDTSNRDVSRRVPRQRASQQGLRSRDW